MSSSSNIVICANRLINANEVSIQIGGATSLLLFRPQPPGDVEASAIVVEGNFISHNGNVGQGIRQCGVIYQRSRRVISGIILLFDQVFTFFVS